MNKFTKAINAFLVYCYINYRRSSDAKIALTSYSLPVLRAPANALDILPPLDAEDVEHAELEAFYEIQSIQFVISM